MAGMNAGLNAGLTSGRGRCESRIRGRRLRFALGILLSLGVLAPGSAGARSDGQTPELTDDLTNGLTGAQLFLACAGCHSLEKGAPHGVGPNLHGLQGRKAASAEGFAYSPALEAADITWSAGTLTAWIVRAEAMVPGTWMLYHNHLEAEEVNRLVQYLLAPDAD